MVYNNIQLLTGFEENAVLLEAIHIYFVLHFHFLRSFLIHFPLT